MATRKVFVVLTMMLGACVSPWTHDESPAASPTPEVVIIGRAEISVMHDTKRAVTCWIYDHPAGGGISCLPDIQIRADGK